MNRFILISTILLLFSLPCSSLPQGIWKTYTRADGLAGDSVVCVTQDKLGNYWFGTWGAGLSKLDTTDIWSNYMNGDSFVVIYDIEIDSLNNKWLALAQLGGHFAGKTHVVKFDDSTFTYYDPTWSPYYNPKPTSLGQDSSGHIWCGTTDSWAYWFDGVNWHEHWVIGSWGELCTIYEIKRDHYGKLYFAHYRGISTLESWLFSAWVTDIDFDSQNCLWFSTYDPSCPLGMFDGQKWQAYTTNDGLLSDAINAVAIDSNNNVWIAYGIIPRVSKFDRQKFAHFNLPQQKRLNLYDIYVDNKGAIWFATFGSGVDVLYDTSTTSVQQIKSTAQNDRKFSLFPNYPNPFNKSTSISYYLTAAGKCNLSIYDITGKEVNILVNEYQQAGTHQAVWNGTNKNGQEVSSGIYIAVLNICNFKQSIKVSLIH